MTSPTETPAPGRKAATGGPSDRALHPTAPVLPLPQGGIVDARDALIAAANNLGPAFGNVFFIPDATIGILLWASFLWAPRHAGYAAVGLGVALVIQRALGIREEAKVGGGLRANAMLSAIAAGWMAGPTSYSPEAAIAIAGVAAATAFFITATIMRVLRRSDFPSLLWGFSFAAGTLFALFPIATTMAAEQAMWWKTMPSGALGWVAAYLRSIGSLVFVPSLQVGLIASCAVFLWSRTVFATGLIGWIAGALVSLAIQSLGLPFHWLPAAYNYFIAGMAIGAYFVVPGYASLLFAAMAGGGTSLCAVALQSLLPAFAYVPTSSALAIWASIATLALAGDRRRFWRNRNTSLPPEEAWWRENCWARRIGREEPLLVVPLPGVVEVAQGFEGTLSHRGALRHAFDFIRQPAGAIPPGSLDFSMGNTLWDAPVVAPVAGTIDRVCNSVPDNGLGLSNFAESWGNYVSLRLDQGGWVLLAHLRQGSIVVKPGMRVELGTYLGVVGNSGRSPVPHLHLHVQSGPEPGSRTVPFRLANYLSAKSAGTPLLEWNASDVPAVTSFVTAALPQPGAHSTLASIAPGTSIWTMEQKGTIPRASREPAADPSLEVGVTLDEWGRYVVTQGKGRLLAALAPDAWRVIEQRGNAPLLKLLAHGVPSIPYAAQVGVTWSDVVPVIPAGPASWISLPLAPYRLQPFTYSRAICLAVPASEGGMLKTESAVAPRGFSGPSRIVCTFDRLRGPVELEATFDSGSVRYSMVSFMLADRL